MDVGTAIVPVAVLLFGLSSQVPLLLVEFSSLWPFTNAMKLVVAMISLVNATGMQSLLWSSSGSFLSHLTRVYTLLRWLAVQTNRYSEITAQADCPTIRGFK